VDITLQKKMWIFPEKTKCGFLLESTFFLHHKYSGMNSKIISASLFKRLCSNGFYDRNNIQNLILSAICASLLFHIFSEFLKRFELRCRKRTVCGIFLGYGKSVGRISSLVMSCT
jgi:hypothetical protein